MGPTGHGLHHLRHRAADRDLMGLAREHVAKPEPGLAADHQELLRLGVVVVPATGHPRTRREVGHLPAVWSAQHLGEAAAGVGVPGQAVGELLGRQVGEVRRMQRTQEAFAHTVEHEIGALLPKAANAPLELAHGGRVDRRHLRMPRPAPAASEVGHERLHHFIDVHEPHRRRRVVHANGHAPRDPVAERGHDRVVVRPAPLPEDAGQPVHDHRAPALSR